MNKNEIHIGGIHYVQIPTLGLISSKIVEQFEQYFVCKADTASNEYYLVSRTGKLQVFPVDKNKAPEIEQNFADGVLIVKDHTPDIPRIVFFKQYSVEKDKLSLVDAIYKQNVVISN